MQFSTRPRPSSFLALLFGVAALVPLAGCKDPDAADHQDPDATSPDASSPDASTDIDAPVDARSIDAQLGAASVRVTKDGAPVAGIIVVAHDAAGEPLGTSTTDAAGLATVAVPTTGGIVSAILSCGNPSYAPTCIHSYAGVTPGEEVGFRAPTQTTSPRFLTRVTIPTSFPGDVHRYTASNGCASSEMAYSFGWQIERFGTAGCFNDPADPRLQFMVIARDENRVPIGFARLLDAAVPVDLEVTTVGPWSDATTPYTITFDDPDDPTSWSVAAYETQGRATWPLLETRPTTRAPIVTARPGIPGTGVLVTWRATVGTDETLDETNIYRTHRGPVTETSFELETSTPRLATIDAGVTDRRPSVAWAFDAAAGDLDGATVTFEARNGRGRVIWYFVTPATPTITFPRLPDDLITTYAPSTVEGHGLLYFRLHGSSSWSGFADMRASYVGATEPADAGPVPAASTQEYHTSRGVYPPGS